MQKIVLTQDAARRIVAAGSTSRNVCRQTLGASPKNVAPSRVNDVRPARIVGEWSRGDAGLWTAKANFVVGDAVDASFEFDVAAPLALESETAPTAVDATAFVVWRGRWELLSAPAGEGSRLGVGTVEALGEEPHYYVVRDSETDALVDAYDPIGYGTLAGTTLLVGQFVVYDYSETLKFHVILNASPL